MYTVLGLEKLMALFQDALKNPNQIYLDPKHVTNKHPVMFAVFQYTLSLKDYNVRGDTKRSAMQDFCDLYQSLQASSPPIQNLYDPRILVSVNKGKTLRLAGKSDAEGLYFSLK